MDKYTKMEKEWEVRRGILSSLQGPYMLLGIGLGAGTFGGIGLYIDNKDFSWDKGSKH